ncbi:DUF4062 domain-containing protein [Streptomyces sp. MMG1533]|uniref:DUF4062 domain-containing protein n=1 Tax=Streptomyces sp. MMG1533 TaxID=1415546 RepID=UPI0006B00746|nr:DUF4062 domain-containing protein [Streptomyces sp. MMG1533]
MRVYLSSTVSDLEEYRAAALAALRRLPFDIVTMEAYTAFDERPLEKCLADVESCDLYIGLFAFRYGFVPEPSALNPDGRSITELEYRKASATGRKRLIFLAKDGAPWPTGHIDALTNPGESSGDSIKQLRTELMNGHGVGWFSNPDQLASAVVSAVAAHLQLPVGGAHPPRPVAEPPHPRRLTGDLHLLHAAKDQAVADRLVSALRGMWNITTSSTDLLASAPDEMLALDRAVTSARTVGLLLSPSLVTVLEENPERARRILNLARARALGPLFGITAPGYGDWAPPDSARWGISEVLAESPAHPLQNQVHAALSKAVGLLRPEHEIGLPVVVVAMTDTEADDLIGTPAGPVADIVRGFGLSPQSARARYGTSRADWRPFGEQGRTIGQVLENAVTGVNDPDLLLRGRKIRLQPYLFDDLLSYDPVLSLVFKDIARNGCLVVADELSLLHQDLESAFLASPLSQGAQVSLITLSPGDPAAGTPHELIRRELAGRLRHADHRFGRELDPLCEMNVASRPHLDRWLRASLPQTLDAYRNARPSADKARRLEAELGTRPSVSMARLITEGGAT